MNESNMSPDDPRLTAYALGELTGEEAATVAEAIARDPALKAEVEAIRALGGDLESVLGAEPLPETEPVDLAQPIEFPLGRRAVKTFPYFWVSGLAAAGFAVLVMVQNPESPLVGTQEFTVYPDQLPPMEMVTYDPSAELADSLVEQPPETVEIDVSFPPATAVRSGFIEPAAVVVSDEAVLNSAGADSEEVVLSPFEVSATETTGYGATKTIASEAAPSVLSAARVVEVAKDNLEPKREDKPFPVVSSKSNSINALGDIGSVDSASGNVANTISSPVSIRTNLRDTGTRITGTLGAAPMMRRQYSSTESVASAEGYAANEEHGWKQVTNAPLSTFAVDVDSASYANVRRFLRSGRLPPLDAVKIEELVNAFTYDYAAPAANAAAPLQTNLEVAAAPWAPEHRLVRVGLKAREMSVAERAPANLVFLLDVSGSMNRAEKLPLVKEAMRLLIGQLREQDRVAIVTYAGQSGLALPSTPVSERRAIIAALDELSAGGSTHGSSGIHLAYDVAKANFVVGGVNRVILCTDGDFNVGTTGLGELERLIEAKAESGVFLTGLGFGTGNYQDDTLELLANSGNGAHGYIDSVREARRLLVEQVNGTLATVAQDVKIQVEFNPAQVSAYRLIGYNNRRLAAEEFNDDTVDAGEVGAGHTVTALYEVIPAGEQIPVPASSVDSLRYQTLPVDRQSIAHAHEMLTVKVRAQPPGGGQSELYEFALIDRGRDFEGATPDFKFAAAVAGFGLRLRELPAAEQFSYAQVGEWARAGTQSDPGGYRSEFLDLVSRAAELSRR